MSECEPNRELLVLFGEGALNPEQYGAVLAHLSGCPQCSREKAQIDSLRRMLADPELFAPAPNQTWQLLSQRLGSRVGETPRGKWWVPADRGAMAWTLAMAATLALTVALAWMVRNQAPPAGETVTAARPIAPGNEAFLGRMQTAYAREATTIYLTQCQDLLIDVVRAEKNCAGDGYDVSLEVTRARELLAQKQLLDRELATPDVAKAKDLCDELEHFLVNLSTSEKCETPDKLLHMEKFIHRQQLLLRINVLQSELS